MSLNDRPLYALTLSEASEGLRAGKFTPLDLTRASLDRIEALDGELHAFATVCPEQALDRAAQITRAQQAGHWRGPLDGIPIAHKDVFLTRGIRSTANSQALSDWVPSIDAALVESFDSLGVVTLGKTVCHEFAFGAPALGDLFLPARNPWDLVRMPGSSSSGSGAAVAAGFCALATGTDTGGSVRHPAAACGLVGFKPTRARFSTAGVIALAPSLDTVGWITRSVEDQRLIWGALGAVDQASPRPLEQLPAGNRLDGLRIGVPRDWLDPDSELSRLHDPEIRDCFEQVRARLYDLGVEWVPLELPPIGEVIGAANQIICTEAAQQVGRWLYTGGPLGVGLRKRLEHSSAHDLEAYHRALLMAWQWRDALDSALVGQRIDLLATPGREQFPETMEALMASGSGPRTVCNRLYSLTGHPALTMPMGLGTSGLPMAIQCAAPLYADHLLLDLSARLERTGLGLPADHPPPWARPVKV